MSIYDNLANSDYVDAGKFREELKNAGTLAESTEELVVQHQQIKKTDLELPGQRYEELDPRDMAAESLRRNPLDQEDEIEYKQEV